MSSLGENTLSALIRVAEHPGGDAVQHSQLWLTWLALSLEEQTRQIGQIISGTGESELLVLPELYAKLTAPSIAPESAPAIEREHFQSNLEICIGLILAETIDGCFSAPPLQKLKGPKLETS